MSTYQRYFIKLKKDTSEIAGFASVPSTSYDEKDYADSEFFQWIEYTQQREEYEEDFVRKARWNILINDVDFGDLENVALGSIIDFNNNTVVLPSE